MSVTPLGVGLRGGEVAFQVIDDVGGSRAAALLAPRAALGNTEQPVPGHQACDPIRTGRLAFARQILVHARHAHDAIARRMVLADA